MEMAKQTPAIAGLIAFIVGLKRRWWVMGEDYKKLEVSEERWEQMALGLLGIKKKTAEANE